VKCGPPSSKPKGRNHQARVPENSLSLIQTLTFDSSDQPVGIDIDVVESQRCSVAQANAVLIFRFVVSETLRVLLHNEPAWAAGSICQDGVGPGHSAVADPLLVPVDLVTDHASILDDWVRSS